MKCPDSYKQYPLFSSVYNSDMRNSLRALMAANIIEHFNISTKACDTAEAYIMSCPESDIANIRFYLVEIMKWREYNV